MRIKERIKDWFWYNSDVLKLIGLFIALFLALWLAYFGIFLMWG